MQDQDPPPPALDLLEVNTPKEEVKKASTELPSLGAVRVHGTKKTHAVMPVEDHIYIRETSCFRSCCWSLGNFHPTCPGWIKRKSRHESGHETPNEQLPGQSTAEQKAGYRTLTIPLDGLRCTKSKHDDAMYFYEPLDGLYTQMYGTKEGWNVPSDITNYSNGKYRIPSNRETVAVTCLLSDLFDCNIDAVPTPVLYHRFWKLFAKHLSSAAKFTRCSTLHRLYKTDKCRQQSLSNICPDRFNSSHHLLEKCRTTLEEVRTTNKSGQNVNFVKYIKCLDDIRSRSIKCDQVLTNICHRRKMIVIKTVRATMASVEDLLSRHRNLRIIHLIRDPRAVVLSRKRFGASSYGIYSTLQNNETMDLVKEAQLYCNTLLRDINERKRLQNKYPGAVIEVVYEKFVLDLVRNAKELYKIIDVPFTKRVHEWLLNNDYGINRERNTSFIATRWWKSVSFGKAKEMAEKCKQVFNHVSSNWP
ncbi:hypothetical protein LSH36_366g06004 [Paralvinella palmiformis]|uniref:Sulfotransferase n=1 Tax=Paralvinella palmiformis TaxID=53620 RepID=A0AAD9JFD1_9ANNE|nr:hypothetical protein LSH36_366g06004 [Paralvinella palmiformis]